MKRWIARATTALMLAGFVCGCTTSGSGGAITSTGGGAITGAQVDGQCPPSNAAVGDGVMFEATIKNTSGQAWPRTYVVFIGHGFTVDNWQGGPDHSAGQQTVNPSGRSFGPLAAGGRLSEIS